MEKQKNPKVFAKVWKHWKSAFLKNKKTLIFTAVFYLSAVCLELFIRPMQWKQVFDNAPDPSIWQNFSIIILSIIFGWMFNRLGDLTIVSAESEIIKQLRDYAMKGLLGKSSHFFTSNSSGKLVTKSKRFSHSSEAVIDEFMFTIFRVVLFVAGLVVYVWLRLPYLGIWISLWVLIFLIVTYLVLRFRLKYDLLSAKADSTTTGNLADIISSVFTLRVFNVTGSVFKKFTDLTEDENKKRKYSWRWSNFQWAIQSVLVGALEIGVMYMVLKRVQAGTETLGSIALVQSFIASLANYMYALGRSVNRVRVSMADAYELSELLEEESVEKLDSVNVSNPKNFSIVCDNLYFKYNGGAHALSGFSFVFKEGRRYGIVGHTGSGKSTLVRLILRLYEKDQGEISISGQDIVSIEKNNIRDWISYVPQDPHFPSWKIKDIVKMGKSDATDEEVTEACKKASCDFIWEKLPKGFDTLVGERGVKLSGGERQRLAIACAILKDAPIVIMDEPTSALDAETEKYIQDAITNCFSGKSMIVVAHRLSTVAVLDEIVVLHDGALLASGSHDELIGISDMYRNMWELQTNPKI